MTILLTGFAPYGGMPSNPASAAALALDGRRIGGARLHGVELPVSMTHVRKLLGDLIEETRPRAVICLGLFPGEPVIRIERVGLNVADFGIADNEGVTMTDQPVAGNGPAARLATLPLRAIERALLKSGTPARISPTAGTYLCNACLYTALDLAGGAPCGFLHVPMTPELVALRLAGARPEALERDPPPSMELSRTIAAVETAIAVTLAALERSPPATA